jgi:hypothetical protein
MNSSSSVDVILDGEADDLRTDVADGSGPLILHPVSTR